MQHIHVYIYIYTEAYVLGSKHCTESAAANDMVNMVYGCFLIMAI